MHFKARCKWSHDAYIHHYTFSEIRSYRDLHACIGNAGWALSYTVYQVPNCHLRIAYSIYSSLLIDKPIQTKEWNIYIIRLRADKMTADLNSYIAFKCGAWATKMWRRAKYLLQVTLIAMMLLSMAASSEQWRGKVLITTEQPDTICFVNKHCGGCRRGNGIALKVAHVEQRGDSCRWVSTCIPKVSPIILLDSQRSAFHILLWLNPSDFTKLAVVSSQL